MKICTFHYYVRHYLEFSFLGYNGVEIQEFITNTFKKAVG